MRAFFRQLRPALVAMAVLTVICGIVYPLVVTGVAQVAFGDEANGSLITRDGQVVGSKLLGQNFTAPQYFHPRPSAAGERGYDGGSSSASNLGPSSSDLLAAVTQRAATYRAENGLSTDAVVPIDAVTASGSGLDPEISVANTRLQARRVASARGLDIAEVLAAVDANTRNRQFGVLGEPGVNVLELNLALDAGS